MSPHMLPSCSLGSSRGNRRTAHASRETSSIGWLGSPGDAAKRVGVGGWGVFWWRAERKDAASVKLLLPEHKPVAGSGERFG